MHVCLVCSEYPPAKSGGIGSFTRDLAEGLVRAGHRATVVGVYSAADLPPGTPADEHVAGVRIVRLRAGRLPARARMVADRLRLSAWLRRAHRRDPLDVVECPDFGGWLAFGAPAGVPSVVRLHNAAFVLDHTLGRRGSRLLAVLERRGIGRAGHVVAVSRFVGELTMRLCGTPLRPFRVIYNAVDTETFTPGSDIERGLIVFTGSIAPKKGVRELCTAMNTVLRRFPEARLVLAGKLPAGRTGEEFLAAVDADLRPRIRFTGAVDRATTLLDLLRRAHVCCFPSHAEAFALAPLEAMAVGRPVVFTRTTSGPEAVEDGVSGLLCDPNDPADIAAKLSAVLGDDALAERLGRGGRLRVRERFRWSEWVPRNVDLYHSLRAPVIRNGPADETESQGVGA